jgi:organic radical activating enzyme
MKPRLKYTEIYITNVCNYSCTHCQSLNNFAFKGHQQWDDYCNEYTKLSNIIEFDTIQIIGGEPTLNPDFEKWVDGISNLWPNSKLQIATNGTRLDKLDDKIYNILLKHKGTLWLTCHDIKLYDGFLDFAKTFLDNVISDNYDPDVNLKTRKLIDSNSVEVILDWSQSFVPSAIDVLNNSSLVMSYNNDPVRAHEICGFKTCHQINKGKLYKCPLVSVLPDFLNQFDVAMSDDDKELAYAYKPLTTSINASEFINTINDPIAQCKFCPTDYNKHKFVGTEKKIKIVPRKLID